MATKLVILVILATASPSFQDHSDNKIDDGIDPIREAKDEILKEQSMQNVGGMLNNFIHSEGAKELGNILSNAASGDKAGEILQGLGSVLGQGKGIDPAMLGTVMSIFQPPSSKQKEEGVDMGLLFSLFGNFMGQGGGGDANANIWSYLPMFLQTANAFLGPEADERAKSHSEHASMVPPLIEKFHLMFDHFVNSEMGKQLFNILGAEKFVKVFADENGRMSYRRFVDMLENHSFRKHWIRMVTNKIANLISHFADPKIQKKYLTTIQHFINSILKSQGYPKSTMFDTNRPTETITALVNHFAREQLNTKISSKQYVKPFVDYVQDVFRLADKRGMLSVDSNELSDKLADTINLEIIEPLARVNRAFRYAKKVPECDKYVMCLVNKEPEDSKPSLPGLRPLLSKSSSLVFSWFLSSMTGTPYLTLYKAITEDMECKGWYHESCNDFHAEEIKVKREVVHSEL